MEEQFNFSGEKIKKVRNNTWKLGKCNAYVYIF